MSVCIVIAVGIFAAKLKDAKHPFPVMTAIHVKSNLSENESFDAMEFSPYETSFPKYGVSMKIKDFQSRFFAGKITSPSAAEPPLKHLHAVFGSAFTKDLRDFLQEWGYFLSLMSTGSSEEEDMSFFKQSLKRMQRRLMALANSKEWRAPHIWNPMKGLQFERMESSCSKLQMSGNHFLVVSVTGFNFEHECI